MRETTNLMSDIYNTHVGLIITYSIITCNYSITCPSPLLLALPPHISHMHNSSLYIACLYIFIKFIYSYVQVKVYDLAIQSVIHVIGHEWCNVSYSVNLGCYSGFLDGYTYYLGTIKPPIPRSPISVYRRGIINF